MIKNCRKIPEFSYEPYMVNFKEVLDVLRNIKKRFKVLWYCKIVTYIFKKKDSYIFKDKEFF